MARASKIIDADIQIDTFTANLAGWLRAANKRGHSTSVTAVTDDEPEFQAPKSDIQREKFHAMIGDIKKTGVIQIPGRRIVMNDYDNEQCKALLVMWFTNEVKGTDITIPNPPRHFICPISGENITIRPSTIKWGKKLTCAFVEWLYATGSMASVTWSEPALAAYNEYREAQ